nr:uncharacterized protein LOC107444783 [Parasteatoda tepidariorum]
MFRMKIVLKHVIMLLLLLQSLMHTGQSISIPLPDMIESDVFRRFQKEFHSILNDVPFKEYVTDKEPALPFQLLQPDIRRNRRSPGPKFLIQGLSRPFCGLFGSKACSPYSATFTQNCAQGYKYDYFARSCRPVQNGK